MEPSEAFWEEVPGIIWEIEKRGENDWYFTRRYGEYRLEHHQEVVGKSLFEISPQGHPLTQQVLQGIASKQDFTFMDGSRPGKIYQNRCKPILDEQGNVCRLIGVSMDITESLAPHLAVLNEAQRTVVDLQSILDQVAQTILNQPDFCDRFFMVYQPVINFKQEPHSATWINGVEALIRLQVEDRIIAPAHFLPALIKNGLSPRVARWVIETAFAEVAPIVYQRPDFFLSINITIDDLMQAEVFATLYASLSNGQFPATGLHIEIIETTNYPEIYQNTEALQLIYQLRDLGVKITVDDFGKQSSNFDRLSLLAPDDVLKIDQSFIPKEIYSQEASICTAMIWVARAFQLKIIAEGIEAPEQATFMKTIGCDFGQGYYFYRPMEIAVLRQILT